MIELEFKSTSTLKDHYAAVRSRLGMSGTPVSPTVSRPAPVAVKAKPVSKRTLAMKVINPAREFLWVATVANPTQPISLDEVLTAVAAYYKYPRSELHGRRRSKFVVKARHVFCWLAYDITARTTPQIGRVAHRDHSTVLYAIEKVNTSMAFYQGDINAIKAQLNKKEKPSEA